MIDDSKIIVLNPKADSNTEDKLGKTFQQFDALLKELRKRALPPNVIEAINRGIGEINSSALTGRDLRKEIKKHQTSILKLLEKELKLVTKNHYLTLWMILGMSVFGIPIGVFIGSLKENMGLLGIGLPIGMAIGLGVGVMLDKKAIKEDRQLDVEIKH